MSSLTTVVSVTTPVSALECNKEFLRVQTDEHSGTQIIPFHFTDRNYITWSRVIRMALGMRSKLEFIIGAYPQPEESFDDLREWRHIDVLVANWMLNTISKELLKDYYYTISAGELWLEFKNKYAKRNGPRLYKIQHEIDEAKQGTQSIQQHFSGLKRLWDEANSLAPPLKCSCILRCEYDAVKEERRLKENARVFQFFTRLSEIYNHLVDQNTLMDPLPDVNLTFSLLSNVESQKENAESLHVSLDGALFSKAPYAPGRFAGG